MNVALWQKIEDFVHQGQIAAAIADLETGLAACKSERFKSLIGAEFTNNPLYIAEQVNLFSASCQKTLEALAIYIEMNGFDINPDRWYFEFFALDKYEEGEENLDWLCSYQSASWPPIALTGLEKSQQDFSWYNNEMRGRDELAETAEEYAILLVMCKFLKLISQVVATGIIEEGIHILAAAHDSDIVASF